MGKLLSERDEQRLSRALPFIERMIRGPVSHSGDTEVVVSQGQQWYRLTSNLDAGGTAKGRKLKSDLTYDATVEEEDITDKLGMWGLEGEKITIRNVLGTLVATSHGVSWHYGKLDGQLNANGSATFSIYTLGGSGSWTDSTINITVYAPPLLATGSIAAGKWGRASYHQSAGRWEVIGGQCDG